MEAEGWSVDPFGAHQDRWFSGGQPTALDRDDGSEGHDDLPSPTFSGSPTPIDDDESTGPENTRRADSADEAYEPRDGARAAWSTFSSASEELDSHGIPPIQR